MFPSLSLTSFALMNISHCVTSFPTLYKGRSIPGPVHLSKLLRDSCLQRHWHALWIAYSMLEVLKSLWLPKEN